MHNSIVAKTILMAFTLAWTTGALSQAPSSTSLDALQRLYRLLVTGLQCQGQGFYWTDEDGGNLELLERRLESFQVSSTVKEDIWHTAVSNASPQSSITLEKCASALKEATR